MNIKQMKSMISKFRSADVSMIKDADMRAKAQKLQSKQGGFTLLELLVVVAILAIIAGAVISSLDGQEELAAQKTTVHTMAAMEEGFQVYRVSEKRRIPADLESLLCSDMTASGGQFSLEAANINNEQLLSSNGLNSNVPRVNGGLTADLADKLTIIDVDTSGALETLEGNGLTSIRYANNGVCNGTQMFTTGGGFEADVDAVPTVEIVKPSLVFRNPVTEDDEWEFGAGASVNLRALDGTVQVPLVFFNEPAELGLDDGAVVAVFGIGPDSGIVGDYIAKAPSDGNTGPDKYSHFSVAYQIGECEDDVEFGEGTCATEAGWDLDTPKVVAILDAGGDAYDDEIAEARGNQEE